MPYFPREPQFPALRYSLVTFCSSCCEILLVNKRFLNVLSEKFPLIFFWLVQVPDSGQQNHCDWDPEYLFHHRVTEIQPHSAADFCLSNPFSLFMLAYAVLPCVTLPNSILKPAAKAADKANTSSTYNKHTPFTN
jgi:hypothetical protein